MSDRAKRVLDALIEYDANHGLGYPYPILTICEFSITELAHQLKKITNH